MEYLQGKGGVDQAIGIHVLGDLNPGTLELVPGARLSGAEIFYIDVKGVGGHGSRPDLTVDPIKATVDCYQRLITIPVNHHSMFDTCVVSPCAIKSGDRFNIIPETGHIEGTIRYYKYGDGQRVLRCARGPGNGLPGRGPFLRRGRPANGHSLRGNSPARGRTPGRAPLLFSQTPPVQR